MVSRLNGQYTETSILTKQFDKSKWSVTSIWINFHHCEQEQAANSVRCFANSVSCFEYGQLTCFSFNLNMVS